MARCLFCSSACPVAVERYGPDAFRPAYAGDGDSCGLCPRGHMIAELVDHPRRLVQPTPSDATEQLAHRLTGSRVAVIVDGHYPCQGQVAAAELTKALGNGSRCCIFIPPCDEEALRGLDASGAKSSPYTAIEEADALLIFGDPFTAQPVISRHVMQARRANRRMTLAVVDSGPSMTAEFATHAVQCVPDQQQWILAFLARRLGALPQAGQNGAPSEHDIDNAMTTLGIDVALLERIAGALGKAKRPVIILSPRPSRCNHWREVAWLAGSVAQAGKAGVVLLTACGNARGAYQVARQTGAVSLADLLGSDDAYDGVLVVGCDLAASLGDDLTKTLIGRGKWLAVASSLPHTLTEKADLVLPLAFPFEEVGTIISNDQPEPVSSVFEPPAGVPTLVGLIDRLARAVGVRVTGEMPTEAFAAPSSVTLDFGLEQYDGSGGDWIVLTDQTVHALDGWTAGYSSWAIGVRPDPQLFIADAVASSRGWQANEMLALSGPGGSVTVKLAATPARRTPSPVCSLPSDSPVADQAKSNGSRFVWGVSGNFAAVRKVFGWQRGQADRLCVLALRPGAWSVEKQSK